MGEQEKGARNTGRKAVTIRSELRPIQLPWWHDRPFTEWPQGARIAYELCAIAAERRLARMRKAEQESKGGE